MNVLEAIADRVEQEPIPSRVAFDILRIIEDENHSLKEVIQLTTNDAALTTEVLKLANTATYRRGEPVSTVNRAILLLGEMMVVGVAICASSSIVFNCPLNGYESADGEMWDHSLRTAVAAREVSRFAKKRISSGLAFTAGLLHDIGKTVISEFLEGRTSELVNACEEGTVADYLEAERKAVGTDHAEVGYKLACKWSLPDSLSVAIRDHHVPARAEEEYKSLVYTVHLADLIAMIGGAGTGVDSLAYSLDDHYEDWIQITKDDFALLLMNVEDEFISIKNLFPKQGT